MYAHKYVTCPLACLNYILSKMENYDIKLNLMMTEMSTSLPCALSCTLQLLLPPCHVISLAPYSSFYLPAMWPLLHPMAASSTESLWVLQEDKLNKNEYPNGELDVGFTTFSTSPPIPNHFLKSVCGSSPGPLQAWLLQLSASLYQLASAAHPECCCMPGVQPPKTVPHHCPHCPALAAHTHTSNVKLYC